MIWDVFKKYKINTYLISWLTFGMCAGIVTSFAPISVLRIPVIWVVLSILCLVLLIRHFVLKQQSFYILIFFTGMCFATGLVHVYDFILSQRIANLEYGDVRLLGKIERVKDNTKISMKLCSIIDQGGIIHDLSRSRIMLKNIDNAEVKEGQTISCNANIFTINSGENLYMKKLFFDGYIGFGKMDKVTLISEESLSLRKILIERAQKMLSKSECEVVVPILFGGSSGSLGQTCRQLGISHLFAISGLHFAIFAGVFFVIGRWILGPLFCLCIRRIDLILTGQIFSFIGIILYLFLAHSSWSVLRSAFTSTILLCAIFFRQQMNAKRATMLALFIILCAWPQAIFDIGMQLSFIATFTLLYSQGNAFTSTLYVFVTTFPYLLYTFGQASLQPFLANLICGTFFSLALMPILGVGAITFFAPPVCFIISKAIYIFMLLIKLCTHIMVCELFHRISCVAVILWSIGIGSWVLIASPFITTLFCSLSFILWFNKPKTEIIIAHNRYDIGFYDNRILWVTNPESAQSHIWESEFRPKFIYPAEQLRINDHQYRFYDFVIDMSKRKNRFVQATRGRDIVLSQWDLVSRRVSNRIKTK